MRITVKRVHEPWSTEDGARVLVDRAWPRGVSRGKARLDLWLRELAPSLELCEWFGHDPEKWTEFKYRYQKELSAFPGVLEDLRAAAHACGSIALLYSAKDNDHNPARVLRDFLRDRL